VTVNFPDPEIIYCDEALIVVEKSAGMLAVPGRGADKQDCVSARLQVKYPDALIVHRLDMATSGLMLFARGMAMQRSLSKLFIERKVQKRYLALVAGLMENESGEIDLPLAADWPNRPKQQVNHQIGKPALTRFRRLAIECNTTRVELEPVTGRTHQLRVHLAALGHAIIGDTLYDGLPASRLMLHACALEFIHPLSSEMLNFKSEAPF
jgi:tRNA pseudouridine32 synthase/23S rRNA pseudouridine746 synthase